jgi:hypothetical protein
LQGLPPLQGYLTISDGTPAARVVVPVQGYEKKGVRFVAGENGLPQIRSLPEEIGFLRIEEA